MSVLLEETRTRARMLVMLAAVAVIAASIAGCGSSATGTPTAAPVASAPDSSADAAESSAPTETSAAAPVTGGTLVVARQQEPTTLNPIVSDNNGSNFVQMQIFEGLVEQVPGTLEPQAALAESWDISPDGLTYTFHVRAAKFSNGDPVTADDVKFSLDRLFDPDIDATMGFLFGNVKGVAVVDASTVRIDMNVVDPALLSELTLPNAAIVPAKILSRYGCPARQ